MLNIMPKNNLRRVPIILSANDFDLLYSIQQGSLLSGKSLRSLWQLSDILKAIIFFTLFNLDGSLEDLNRILKPFYENKGLHLSQLPTEFDIKSIILNSLNENFTQIEAKHVHDRVIDAGSIIFSNEFGLNDKLGSIPTSGKTSNFILSINDAEFRFFKLMKIIIESYVKRELSYSEIVRTIFRSLISVNGKESSSKAERWLFLSLLYFGSLYGFSPVESVMILLVNIDNESGSMLVGDKSYKTLYSLIKDEVILNRYAKELEGRLDSGFESKEPNEIEKKIKPIRYGFGFSEIEMNSELEDGFRSAVANFGFHSAFIGYIFLYMEWEFGQHKFPLLAPYLLGELKQKDGTKTTVQVSPGSIYAPSLLKSWFLPILKDLYNVSKTYREKGKLS